jgi:hypothetical protein
MRSKASIKRGLKEKIIFLHKDGLSLNNIAKKLNCSTGTVSYHISEGQKEKNSFRRDKQREGLGYKILRYMNNWNQKNYIRNYDNHIKKINDIRGKLRNFMYSNKKRKNRLNFEKPNYRPLDLWRKIWPDFQQNNKNVQAVNQWNNKLDFDENNQPILYPYVRCRLTDIIINAVTESHIDHINSNPCDNSFENFSIVHKLANQAKTSMNNEELYFFCLNYINVFEKYKNKCTN